MIRLPHRSAASRMSRRGFTLLELTLALGLTVVLLTAVYRAMELHWQFSIAGQVEVERSQIARALLTKIAADIRSTVYRVESGPSGTMSATSDDTDVDDTDVADDTTLMEVTDPADAYSSDATGVFGDNVSLVLHISRPTREKESPTGDSTGTLTLGDLKSVSYFLAGGEASLAGTLSGPLTEVQNEDGIDGLARMSGDRFALMQASSAGDAHEVVSGR